MKAQSSEREFFRIVQLFDARKVGREWLTFCPCHEDKHRSLGLRFDYATNKILAICRANCSQDEVWRVIREKLSNFNGNRAHPEYDYINDPEKRLVCAYDYVDAKGKLHMQNVRYEPGDDGKKKTFRPRYLNSIGEWVYGLPKKLYLYNYLEVQQAQQVIVTEGEKDADTVSALGFVATTSGGAGSWRPEHAEQLRGKEVIVCPDTDEAGESYLQAVTSSLTGVASRVAVIRIPKNGLNGEPYNDISDWRPSSEVLQMMLRSAATVGMDFYHSFEDFEQAKPLSFAIEGFLQNDAITAIAGLSGQGKTWLALSIVKALLNGPGVLWSYFKVLERAEKVIYLVPESTLSPFKHRLQKMGLYDDIKSERLLVRTLSKGPTPELSDASLLHSVKNAHIVLDTTIRFIGESDDNSASEIAHGLSEDLLRLLRSGARSILTLFHAAKAFRKDESMNLENMIRGTGEHGAILSTAWGIKKIDEDAPIYVQNIKPRDFEPCGPFELSLRPSIDRTGDIELYKKPGDTPPLAERQRDHNSRNNRQKKELRILHKSIVVKIHNEEPTLSSSEISERLRLQYSIDLKPVTVRSFLVEHEKEGGDEQE